MKCRADQELSTGVEIVEASTTVKEVNRWTSARWGTAGRTICSRGWLNPKANKSPAGCALRLGPRWKWNTEIGLAATTTRPYTQMVLRKHTIPALRGGGGPPALGVNSTHTKKKWPQRRAFQRPVLIVADTWKSGPSSRTKIFQSALERPPPSCCDCAPLLPFPRCAEVNELTTFIFRNFLTFSLPSHNGNVASTKRTI